MLDTLVEEHGVSNSHVTCTCKGYQPLPVVTVAGCQAMGSNHSFHSSSNSGIEILHHHHKALSVLLITSFKLQRSCLSLHLHCSLWGAYATTIAKGPILVRNSAVSSLDVIGCHDLRRWGLSNWVAR